MAKKIDINKLWITTARADDDEFAVGSLEVGKTLGSKDDEHMMRMSHIESCRIARVGNIRDKEVYDTTVRAIRDGGLSTYRNRGQAKRAVQERRQRAGLAPLRDDEIDAPFARPKPPRDVASMVKTTMPVWHEAYGFPRAYRHSLEFIHDHADVVGSGEGAVASGMGAVAYQAALGLHEAHVLSIGQDQLNALPEWDSREEEVAFARNVRLPFPIMFFDFGNPRGPSWLKWARGGDMEILSVGALVFDGRALAEQEDRPWPVETDGNGLSRFICQDALTIIHFGTSVRTAKSGVSGYSLASAHDDVPLPRYAPLGIVQYGYNEPCGPMVQFGDLPSIDPKLPDTKLELMGFVAPLKMLLRKDSKDGPSMGGFYGGSPHTMRALGRHQVGEMPEASSFSSQWTIDRKGAQQPLVSREVAVGMAMDEAKICVIAAEYVLSCIYLLQAHNVSLKPSDESRVAQRRMLREGGQMSSVVAVRRSRVARRPNQGDGLARNFSHRHERAGVYRHMRAQTHPHVRCNSCRGSGKATDWDKLESADKPLKPSEAVNFEVGSCSRCHGTGLDPEKVKPCFRTDPDTGERTCPNGCRLEWSQPTWVGDESLPMVPKTRVWKG